MYFMKVIQNQNSRRALHARLVVWFVSLPLSLLISPNLQMNYTNWKKLQIKYKFHHPSSSDPITIFSLDTLTPPRVVDLGLVPVAQVPKTSVNLDGDVREKFMCSPSLLTQGSWEWWVSQISTSRILHSGPNFR